jgi:hypothetical protein
MFLRRLRAVFDELVQADVKLCVEQPLLALAGGEFRLLDLLQDLLGRQLAGEKLVDRGKRLAVVLGILQQPRASLLAAVGFHLRQITPDAVLTVDVVEVVILLELRRRIGIPPGVEVGDPPSPVRCIHAGIEFDQLVVVGDRFLEFPREEVGITAARVGAAALRILFDGDRAVADRAFPAGLKFFGFLSRQRRLGRIRQTDAHSHAEVECEPTNGHERFLNESLLAADFVCHWLCQCLHFVRQPAGYEARHWRSQWHTIHSTIEKCIDRTTITPRSPRGADRPKTPSLPRSISVSHPTPLRSLPPGSRGPGVRAANRRRTRPTAG